MEGDDPIRRRRSIGRRLALGRVAKPGAEAIRHHREHRPDVTLMDLRLPDLSGIDAMIAIRGVSSGAKHLGVRRPLCAPSACRGFTVKKWTAIAIRVQN